MTELTGAEFDELFTRFVVSPTSLRVFRFEGLQHYKVDPEDAAIRAFRTGSARPERSVRTSPWLRRIATSTAAGKVWERVHSIVEPLSEYLEFELLGYVESQSVGERIGIAVRTQELAALGPDFWLFDGSAPGDRYAVLMHYDASGTPTAFEYVTDEVVLRDLARQRDLASSRAIALNEYRALRDYRRAS